jgi:hypothetical protein
MFSQRSKEQRPVILHPKISFVLYETTQTLITFVQWIGSFKVFRVKPLLIATSDGRVYNGTLVSHPKK